MITSPARKISSRLTVTYAGFEGESVLLEEIYKRGIALPEVAPSLRAGDGMLFAGIMNRLRLGRLKAGSPRCAAACAPTLILRHDREQVCRQRVELHRSCVLGRLRRPGCEARAC